MNTRKVYLEIIRFIAACLVVFNHTDGYFLYFASTDNMLTYGVSLFFSVLCKINVPLFFMVSGALLIHREEQLKTLFRIRILRIAAVLLIFSGVQYIAGMLTVHGLEGKGAVSYSLREFLRQVYGSSVIEPYWFLYSYLAVLLLLPFLRRLAKAMTAAEFRYLFMLKAVFDIGLRLIGVYTGVFVNLELFIVADNIFYVLFGYYMECVVSESRYKEGKCLKAAGACIGLVVLSALAVIGEYVLTGEYSQRLLGIFNPFLVITVYYMVKSFCMEHVLTEKIQRICIWLGSTVFGIYLLEQLIRRQLLPLYLFLCEKTVGVVACFAYVAGTVALGVVYVSILKKIPGIKKLI